MQFVIKWDPAKNKLREQLENIRVEKNIIKNSADLEKLKRLDNTEETLQANRFNNVVQNDSANVNTEVLTPDTDRSISKLKYKSNRCHNRADKMLNSKQNLVLRTNYEFDFEIKEYIKPKAKFNTNQSSSWGSAKNQWKVSAISFIWIRQQECRKLNLQAHPF